MILGKVRDIFLTLLLFWESNIFTGECKHWPLTIAAWRGGLLASGLSSSVPCLMWWPWSDSGLRTMLSPVSGEQWSQLLLWWPGEAGGWELDSVSSLLIIRLCALPVQGEYHHPVQLNTRDSKHEDKKEAPSLLAWIEAPPHGIFSSLCLCLIW